MRITVRHLRRIIREEISKARPLQKTGRRRRLVREAKTSGTLSDVVSILTAYKRAADQGALGEDRFLSDFLDQSAESDGSRWLRSLDHEDFREIENDIAGPRAVSARQIRSYVSDRWGDDIKASDPGKAAAPWVNLDPSTKQAVIRFLSTHLAKERAKWDSGDEENEGTKLLRLWHEKCRHLNFDDLVRLSKITPGMPDLSKCARYKCHCCMKSKAARKTHPKSTTRRSKEPLGRLHIDFSGPFRKPSLGGARYMLVAVDDMSRTVWVFLTKNRSGEAVSECLKQLFAQEGKPKSVTA